ncbi:MAG TPA: tetratricopeptide repeat protein [Nitrospirota bacterium]|nr:tetratricopeptide repeat protein [Nitrospirota bacterium]
MRYPTFLISGLLLLSLHLQTTDAAILYSIPVEVPVVREEIPWPVSVQGDGAAIFEEAVGNYRSGHYEEAISQFSNLTREHPKSDAARAAILWLGSLYFKMAMQEGKRDTKLLMSALESFQENVRNSPNPTDTPRVLMEIGKIYREMSLTEESKGSFKRVIKEYPSAEAGYAPEAQYQIAMTYELEGDFREAVSAYHVLSLRYPGKMEEKGVFGTGRALVALHEFGEARKYYEEGLKRWPGYVKGHPEVLFNYSECQFQNGEFPKAREGFLTFYNLYPKNSDAGFALNRVGDTYLMERKGAVAEHLYLDVLRLFPKGEDALVSKLALGDIRFVSLSGNLFYQDSLKYYQDVESSSSGESYILAAKYRIGRVLEAEGRYRRSLTVYSELLDKAKGPLRKEVSRSFNALTGKIGKDIEDRISHNDYFGVVKEYQAAYKNFIDRIDNEELLVRIADVHRKLLLHQEASSIYQKIIDRNGPQKALALFKAGELYADTGDPVQAVETLGRYIADYPTGERAVSARALLGESLYNLKEYEKAANYFYAVMRETPYRYPSVYIRLSGILFNSGHYEDSANILRDLIRHLAADSGDGLWAAAHIALGNALHGLKRYQEALDAYEAGLNRRDLKEESETVQLMVGDCLWRLNRRDEAQKVFTDLSQKSAGAIKQFSEERLKDISLNLSL